MEEELHGKPGIDQPLFHPGNKTPNIRVYGFIADCGCCVKKDDELWPKNTQNIEKKPCAACQERMSNGEETSKA